MKYALVEGSKAEAAPDFRDALAVCPVCNADVIPKCGTFKVHHWAHKAALDCDPWWEPESEWHRRWKDILSGGDPSAQEVTLGRHRADVHLGGLTIELQNSPLSQNEIWEREAYYGSIGTMIWLWNADSWDLRCGTTGQDMRPVYTWLRRRQYVYACRHLVFITREEKLCLLRPLTAPLFTPARVELYPVELGDVVRLSRLATDVLELELLALPPVARPAGPVRRRSVVIGRQEKLEAKEQAQKEFPLIGVLKNLRDSKPDLAGVVDGLTRRMFAKVHLGPLGHAYIRWWPGVGLSPRQALVLIDLLRGCAYDPAWILLDPEQVMAQLPTLRDDERALLAPVLVNFWARKPVPFAKLDVSRIKRDTKGRYTYRSVWDDFMRNPYRWPSEGALDSTSGHSSDGVIDSAADILAIR